MQKVAENIIITISVSKIFIKYLQLQIYIMGGLTSLFQLMVNIYICVLCSNKH